MRAWILLVLLAAALRWRWDSGEPCNS